MVLLAVGLIGTFIIVPAQTAQVGEVYGLPPSLFPMVGVVLLSVCAGLKIVLSMIQRWDDEEAAAEQLNWHHGRHIAALTAGLVVSVMLIEHLGFLIGGPITVAALMLYMGTRKPVTLVAVAIGAPLAIYLFFWQLLRISVWRSLDSCAVLYGASGAVRCKDRAVPCGVPKFPSRPYTL